MGHQWYSTTGIGRNTSSINTRKLVQVTQAEPAHQQYHVSPLAVVGSASSLYILLDETREKGCQQHGLRMIGNNSVPVGAQSGIPH